MVTPLVGKLLVIVNVVAEVFLITGVAQGNTICSLAATAEFIHPAFTAMALMYIPAALSMGPLYCVLPVVGVLTPSAVVPIS